MTFFEDIRESEIREIFHFWCARRRGGDVPLRAAIDPAQIPHRLLPHMFIYAKEKDGRYLRRLMGTGLTRIYGRDHTGRYLHETMPTEAAAHRQSLYDRVLATGCPAYMRGIAIVKMGEQRQCGRIMLPLASHAGRVDQILGLVRFGPRERQVPEPIALRALANPKHVLFATAADLDIVDRTAAESETATSGN